MRYFQFKLKIINIVITSCFSLYSPVMSFEYVVENISNCSVTCGCGMQTQDVACRQIITVGGVVMNNTVTVPEIYCQGQSRPLDRIQCFNPPCPRYREGPFGEVYVHCCIYCIINCWCDTYQAWGGGGGGSFRLYPTPNYRSLIFLASSLPTLQ